MDAINFAVEAGRKLQKKQTGFVHYCSQSEDLTTHDTIPVLENALFALSLFRTRLSDNVLEGKALIEKLLKFEVDGNFPNFLHAYPQITDSYLNLRLLPILFWICVDFGHVIGGLKQILEACIERIIARAKSSEHLANWAQFRLDAYEGKIGPLPNSLHEWSEALISLQLAEKRGAEIETALKEGFKLWHPELSLYIGPALRRNQHGSEPELTLFDLFMCQWQKRFTERTGRLAPVHLQGALIRPLGYEPEFPQQPVPFVHFNKEEECPLFIAWEKHSFVLAKHHLRVEGRAEDLEIYLKDAGDDFAVHFYFNYHPDHEIFINSGKANTFYLKDRVEIRSKGLTMQLSLEAADGKYMGHVLRGNRPSQHLCKGENQFAAYDWLIAIRVIELGSAPIRVRLLLEQTQESRLQLPLHAAHCPHTESPQ